MNLLTCRSLNDNKYKFKEVFILPDGRCAKYRWRKAAEKAILKP